MGGNLTTYTSALTLIIFRQEVMSIILTILPLIYLLVVGSIESFLAVNNYYRRYMYCTVYEVCADVCAPPSPSLEDRVIVKSIKALSIIP